MRLLRLGVRGRGAVATSKGQGANVTGYPGKASMAENGQDRNSNQEVKTTDEQN